ncbi:MAG: hypothetical protein AB7O97_18030 [Planctomycetota bacterium]
MYARSSRRPSAALLLAGAALLGALPLRAQTATADPILARLPAGATNLLILRDPMPVVEAVLRAPALAKVADATADAQRQLFGTALQPAALSRQIDLFADFVPVEVVLAAPPATVNAIADALRATVAGWMLLSARGADPALQGDLRTTIAAALADLPAPAVLGWVRARSERVADRWFEALAGVLDGARDPSLSVTVGDDDIAFELAPAQLAGGQLPRLLQNLQVDAAALDALRIPVRIEQRGAVLELRVGAPRNAPLAADSLGPLWRPGPDQLVFVHADWKDGQDRLFESWDLFEAGAEELPDAMWEVTTRVSETLGQLTDMAPRLAMRVGAGGGLRWDIDHYYDDDYVVELEPLPPELLRMADPDEGSVGLSSMPFDFVLAAVVEGAMSRMAQRANRTTREVFDYVQEHGGDLLDYLYGDESSVFDAGTASLTRGAALRSLTVPGVGTLRDLPFVATAVVAVAEDEAAGTGFVDAVSAHVGKLLGEHGAVKWSAADLGFSAPTRTLDVQGLLPAIAALELDADFAPHHVQRGALMILSTDPALTRDLLARLDGQAKAALPIANPASWSHMRGDQVGGMLAGLATWIDAVGGALGDDSAAQWSPALRALGEACGEIAYFENTTSIDGQTIRDRGHIALRRDGR